MDIPNVVGNSTPYHFSVLSDLKRELNHILSLGVKIDLNFKGHSFPVHHFSTEVAYHLSAYHRDNYRVDLQFNQLHTLQVTDILKRPRSFVSLYNDKRDSSTKFDCKFRTWNNKSFLPYYIIIPTAAVKRGDMVLELKTSPKKNSRIDLLLHPIVGKDEHSYYTVGDHQFDIKTTQVIQFLEDLPISISEDYPFYTPLCLE